MLRLICVIYSFLFFTTLFVPVAAYSQDAEIPVIVDDYIDLFDSGTNVLEGISDGERNTCDPEFWDVMKDRAWMEAQRELTQNWNIVPRPDSVMVLGCFNHYMNKLAHYGHENFPLEPDEAAGQLAPNVWNNLAIYGIRLRIAVTLGYQNFDPDGLGYEASLVISDALIGNGGDPWLTGGIMPYALLELLVLDQLVDDVSDLGRLEDGANFIGAAAACGGKDVYLEDNFPDLALGERAIDKINTPPAAITNTSGFTEINTLFDSNVLYDVGNINNCDMMMRVWTRAQCYDFAMESTRYMNPAGVVSGTPPAVVYGGVSSEHDGFYSLERYRDVAATNSDFRTKAVACSAPTVDSDPDTSDIVCDFFEHGLPFPDVSSFSSFLTTFSAYIPPPDGDSPVWSTAQPGANPIIGAAGAPDEFVDYLELRGEGVLSPPTPFCGSPVKTGFLVVDILGQTYEDAFCTVPGCWFNPPTSVGANGTCSQ